MLVRSNWVNTWTGLKARITMGERLMYKVEVYNNANDTWVVNDEYVHLRNAEAWLRESGFAREV